MKNWLRPASLGYLDGAVTNMSMLAFSVGAIPDAALAVGIAGWIAGSLSMSINEYVSVSDQGRAEGTEYSPTVAACSSFCAFSLGALVPLVPLILGLQVIWGLYLGSFGLFVSGSVLAQFTGRGWVQSGARQLGFGILACILTLGAGLILGVQV